MTFDDEDEEEIYRELNKNESNVDLDGSDIDISNIGIRLQKISNF